MRRTLSSTADLYQQAIRPVSDKAHYVDLDVRDPAAAAFQTGTVSLYMAFWRIPTLLQLMESTGFIDLQADRRNQE